MGRRHSSGPLTPSVRFMRWFNRSSCLQERSLHMPRAQTGASPSPTPSSFLVMASILVKEGPFQEGRSLGFQHLPRQRWPSSLGRTVWQGGGGKAFSGVCSQINPSPFPPANKGKSRRHHPTRPDTQGAAGNKISGVSSFTACSVHSTPSALQGLSSSQGSVWKNPCQGRVGRPQSLPNAGSSGATDAPLPLDTSCLSEHLG